MSRATPPLLAGLLLLGACGRSDGPYTVRDDAVIYSAGNGKGGVERPVRGADPGTFRHLGLHVAADKHRGYVEGRAVDGSGPGFRLLPDGGHFAAGRYAADGRSAFYIMDRVDRLATDSAEDFRLLGDVFATDGRAVFYAGVPVPGADPETFEHLGGSYARDAARFYWGPVAFEAGEDFRLVRGYRRPRPNEYPPSDHVRATAAVLAATFGPQYAVCETAPGAEVVIENAIGRDGEGFFDGPRRAPREFLNETIQHVVD